MYVIEGSDSSHAWLQMLCWQGSMLRLFQMLSDGSMCWSTCWRGHRLRQAGVSIVLSSNSTISICCRLVVQQAVEQIHNRFLFCLSAICTAVLYFIVFATCRHLAELMRCNECSFSNKMVYFYCNIISDQTNKTWTISFCCLWILESRDLNHLARHGIATWAHGMADSSIHMVYQLTKQLLWRMQQVPGGVLHMPSTASV